MGVLKLSEKDDKYVLRSEWLHNTGKIYERINENDRKHLEAYNSLNSKIERQTGLQEKQFESQERQEKHLEKISDVVESFGNCLLYTSPSPRDMRRSRMPSSA